MRHIRPSLVCLGLVACGLVPACQSQLDPTITPDYFTGTTLDRNDIAVAEDTRSITIAIDPASSWMQDAERDRIRAFAADYRRRGHGPLVVAVPSRYGSDPYTVPIVAEARDVAWAAGIPYERVLSRAYNAGDRADAPLIISFQTFQATGPYCPPKSATNFADISSNNDMTTLGCSVRTNMAEMIAEPGDLLGNRPLDPGDAERRAYQLELYRQGQATGAERSEDETGAVSTAVN